MTLTVPRNVIVWLDISEWGPKILDFVGGLISRDVTNKIRTSLILRFVQDDREYCNYQDLARLLQRQLDAVGMRRPILDLMADWLRKEYSHVRVFHACHPVDVKSYYTDGIVTHGPGALKDRAREYFLTNALPEVTPETLERAIVKADEEFEYDGQIYFALDDRDLKLSGHYLIYGSEYLELLAAHLKRQTGKDCFAILRSIGIPTMFACDLPFSYIESQTPERISGLCGRLLEHSFYEPVWPQGELPLGDLSFRIGIPLPPSLIVSHYHPTEILDDLDGSLYRAVQSKCLLCDL